ncbi:MAG: DUF2846 domain-containing protein [Deltaproteobacteria bacterium]|nr:DUF2846 domain-containing protein [Deltaproteobacteria bacterium]
MKYSAGMIALLFCLSGCSASGPRFQDTLLATQPVATDNARIVFYRESDMNFRSATIGIDGSIVGALAHNGFIVADIAPGDHKISAWVRGFPFHEFVIGISVEAGKTYYMRVSQRTERLLYPMLGVVGSVIFLADTKGEFQLELMPQSTALQQLKELKLSE